MEYLSVPTRVGREGSLDKAALATALAEWTASTNRDFLYFVRNKVKDCKSAEDQADKWFEFVTSRTYTREFGDVFSHPKDTVEVGGDCDDLTVLLMAGLLAIGIPTVAEVIEVDGNGVHIRARVGFPPHNPPRDFSKWKIYDSTKVSEPIWAGVDGGSDPKMVTETFTGLGLSKSEDANPTVKKAAIVAAAALAAFGLYRLVSK